VTAPKFLRTNSQKATIRLHRDPTPYLGHSTSNPYFEAPSRNHKVHVLILHDIRQLGRVPLWYAPHERVHSTIFR
jgi:hypothetical protein